MDEPLPVQRLSDELVDRQVAFVVNHGLLNLSEVQLDSRKWLDDILKKRKRELNGESFKFN